MFSIIRYTLLTASRDWLFIGIFLLVLISISLSAFLGDTAIVEQSQMIITYIASSTRVITVVGLILFTCFHIRRAFENKEIELILSRPISRLKFIFSYFLGFAILAIAIVLPIIGLLVCLDFTGYLQINKYGLVLWSFSLYLENLLLMTFAFFISLILQSAVSSSLLCFAFYFLARIMGFFLISINNPASVGKNNIISYLLESSLDYIGALIPRIDMLGQSSWLIYGLPNNDRYYIAFLIGAMIYICLLLIMSLFDFMRKQF